MPFDNVIGQARPKKILKRLLSSGRMPHALLLYGPEGIGKKAMAVQIAMAANCLKSEVDPCGQCSACRKISTLQHPDLRILHPGPPEVNPEHEAAFLSGMAENPYLVAPPARNRTIPIERTRELRREAILRPFEAKRKVALIFDADYMRPEAANALLKTLEEPPNELLFVLTTSRPGSVLPTILSRCQPLGLSKLSEEDIEHALVEQRRIPAEHPSARLTAKLADGNLTRAYEMLDSEHLGQERNEALEFLRISVEGTTVQALEWAESWSKNKDHVSPERFLELVLIWIRDAFLQLQSLPEEATNFDCMEDIVQLASALNDRVVGHFLSETERALEMISRNVNLQLVLLHLMSVLRKSVPYKNR